MSEASPVHVLGATGRTGALLCAMLAARGIQVIPLVRDRAKWAALNLPGAPRTADLTAPETLRAALADATRIVSVSYAAWTEALLLAAPEQARLVLTGTARRYSPLPDPAGQAATRAEALLHAAGRDGAILHPTMIYGTRNDGTLTRLAASLRRPLLPLPDGGRPLVQPIHAADLAAALIAALDRGWGTPAAIPLGGPEPLPYAALVRAVAHATHRRPPLILPVPASLVRWLGKQHPALLRLLEDRTVDNGVAHRTLGFTPRPLAQGLAEAAHAGFL